MSKLILGLSFLSLICACVGQAPTPIIQNGQCPTTINVVPNFNTQLFAGEWMEYSRLPQAAQTGQCNRAVYTQTAATTLSVVNSQVTAEVMNTVIGQAVVTGAGGSGVLQVTLNLATGPATQTVYVLATDYANYALLYSCTNIPNTNTRQIGSWQLRKNSNPLTSEANTAIQSAINSVDGLNAVTFLTTQQTTAACFYYPVLTTPPATIDLPGSCSSAGVTGVANFDLTRFLGEWQEIARYPQPTQTGQCNRANYAAGATANTVSVVNGQVINEALSTISGAAIPTAQSGVLQVTLNTASGPVVQNLFVLATDHDSYALLYTCSDIQGTNNRRVGSWQMRKGSNALSQTAVNAINAAITATQGLRADYYQPTLQTNAACFYYPEFPTPPATIDLPGPCSSAGLTGVANFDFTRFVGEWQEIARYPQPRQTGQCNRANYVAGATPGSASVVNSQVVGEALSTASGFAETTSQSGVLLVTMSVGEQLFMEHLHVLATDYDSYALLYTCTDIEGTNNRRVGSWQMRKGDNALSQQAIADINSVITAVQGLRAEYYQPTLQTNEACFYYPVFPTPPATIDLPGPCNSAGVTGVPNFDVTRFLGEWQEIARYPQPTQTGQCNRANYAAGATANTVSVVNSQVISEALSTISGTAVPTTQSGVLQVTLNTASGAVSENLFVLATDYDSYALLYTCSDIQGTNNRRVGSWQMRKGNNALSQQAVTAINAAITATQGLRADYYQPTLQTNAACFYYPVFPTPPATIDLPGPCSSAGVTGVANFDAPRFHGTWQEIARYPQPTQTGQCNRATYAAGAIPNTVSVLNSQVVSEALSTISGVAIPTAQSGVLQVTLNTASGPVVQNLFVLATDYDSYALLYTCSDIQGTNNRRVGSWQLRKGSNALSQQAVNAINAAITATQGLRADYYQPTLQTNAACFYYPEFTTPPVAIELPGPCNTGITGVASFDLARFYGAWQEIARYPQPTQTGQCNRAVYAAGQASGTVSVVNTQVVDQVLGTISGQAVPTAQSGVFQVTLNAADGPRVQNLHVLATDYDTYALLYSCTNVPETNTRIVGSWQMRKGDTPLTPQAVTAMNAAITATEGLRADYYQPTLQDNDACWHYPEQTGEHVILPGACAAITGVANINLTAFAEDKVWYQIRRYDAVGGRSCIGNRLRLNENYIRVNSIEVVNGEAAKSEGVARLSAAATGQFTLVMDEYEDDREEIVFVLATDYEGYAIAYSCKNVGTNRQIGAWLLSRQRTAFPAAGTTALNALVADREEFTLRDTYFKTISHAGECPDPSSAFLFKSSIIMIFVCTVLHLVW